MSDDKKLYAVGELVEKRTGDYEFPGVVVGIIDKYKRDLSGPSGVLRYVVQDERGALHIFNASQLAPKP